MQIDTDNFSTIRAAEYDESTDLLRMVIICRPEDVRRAVGELTAPHNCGPSSLLSDIQAIDDVLRGASR